MTILIKAGTGLVAGVVAGGLGLAFLPRVEPNAVKPRVAVEKPQFVVAAVSAQPTTPPNPRAAPTIAVAAETPVAKPSPTPDVKAFVPTPQAKVAPTAPLAIAAIDPPKPAPVTRAIAFAEPSPTAISASIPKSAPEAPKPAAKFIPEASMQTAAANGASAPWSIRGLVALGKGDLSSARVFLARAADAGDPRALVALADTYDPAMLAKFGVVGAPGDAQRAKEYLTKAAAAGVVAAKDRMAALDQTSQ